MVSFTSQREVKAMCDFVKHETERIDSRFLEPACGDGNFLAEILVRKLNCSQMKKYRRNYFDWERYSLLVLGSLYGIDILFDNVEECRQRLYDIWEEEYRRVCKKECNDETRAAAKFIISRNIVCGNALTLMCVDENCNDTEEPIVFSQWSFLKNDAFISRKDYILDELVRMNGERKESKIKQVSMLDENTPHTQDEGRFIMEYIIHYRRLGANV